MDLDIAGLLRSAAWVLFYATRTLATLSQSVSSEVWIHVAIADEAFISCLSVGTCLSWADWSRQGSACIDRSRPGTLPGGDGSQCQTRFCFSQNASMSTAT